MKTHTTIVCASMLLAVVLVLPSSDRLLADDHCGGLPSPTEALRWLQYKLSGGHKKTPIDVRDHDVCSKCGQIHGLGTECIGREAIEDCVKGKMKVYDCKVRYEYVVIPEVRYRWKTKWVTKEVPADYQKPVCNDDPQECSHLTEEWQRNYCGNCEIQCKTLTSEPEQVSHKSIECEDDQTTVRLKYKTCVKVPYTVYRQVRREICVKMPRNEKVEMPVTRHCGRVLKEKDFE